jgi:hypothetical protein
MGRLSNKFYDIPSHTTTSGTDLSEYWPGEGGFHNPGFKELRVVTNRTAETGTCTLDVDADGYLVVNTVDAWFNYVLPQFFRVKFKSGGTTVTNTFSSTIFLLNG